jgi:hypothetical protein
MVAFGAGMVVADRLSDCVDYLKCSGNKKTVETDIEKTGD